LTSNELVTKIYFKKNPVEIFIKNVVVDSVIVANRKVAKKLNFTGQKSLSLKKYKNSSFDRILSRVD
jgi:hypothetical protein